MADNEVISEAGLLEIMNAQPFAETRNDPMRVWQLFGERVHVGDAIKAILSLAGFNELREYRTAAGMFAIEKAEQRRIAESLKSENEALQQQPGDDDSAADDVLEHARLAEFHFAQWESSQYPGEKAHSLKYLRGEMEALRIAIAAAIAPPRPAQEIPGD